MPARFRKTLRGRLLAWLFFPLLLLSAAHLYSTYVETKRTSTALFDKLLITLALSISEYAISSEGDLLTVDLLELISQATNDKLYYKVLGPDGSFLVGYESMPEPEGGMKQINNHFELYDAVYLGQPVRVIAVSIYADRSQFSGWSKTLVAQTMQDRHAFVHSAMMDSIIRVIGLIIIASALLSIGISKAMKPLLKLQKSLNKRDINDLTELQTEQLPEEIKTVAVSINELFARLANQIGLSKRFVENASHQLRTPIAALTLQCDLALRRSASEAEKSLIEKIRQNANRMARMTHQLLHLTASEAASSSSTAMQPLDLANIAQQCIARFTEQNPQATISTSLQAAPIDGNETLIVEVYTNLMENALKYGDGCGFSVRTYTDGEQSILEVKDQGAGIALEHRQLVTERFFRAHTDQDGSGLGLAIVKEIALVHKGRIDIGPGDNNKGTRIRCIFPKLKSHS